jgi:hypothetical protein
MITLPSLHALTNVLTADVSDHISRRSCMLNRSSKSGQRAVRCAPGLTRLKLGDDKLFGECPTDTPAPSTSLQPPPILIEHIHRC